MRRTIFGLMLACVFLYCHAAGAAGGDKKGKTLQKECKQVCKKLKAEGWEVYGQPLSIDAALTAYYEQLEQGGDDVVTVIGMGSGKAVNTAVRKAMNHATAQYAAMKGSVIEGQAASDFTAQTTDSAAVEQESHSVSYSSSVRQRVQALKPVLTLTRKHPDNTVEVQTYYLVKP